MTREELADVGVEVWLAKGGGSIGTDALLSWMYDQGAGVELVCDPSCLRGDGGWQCMCYFSDDERLIFDDQSLHVAVLLAAREVARRIKQA